jgi:hypothetical protein
LQLALHGALANAQGDRDVLDRIASKVVHFRRPRRVLRYRPAAENALMLRDGQARGFKELRAVTG